MMQALDESLAARFTAVACAALTREYPNHLTHWLNDVEDAREPRALHPAFYGCLDWHSAVHNHWLLARLLRLFPDAGFVQEARALLERHLTPTNLSAEREYFAAPGREGFERPYGWAWLLALDAELAPWPHLRAALSPLAELIASRIAPWLTALPYPVRSGEHANTAFALALMFDWAVTNSRVGIVNAVHTAAENFYGRDVDAALAFEPGGHDFLSPVLAEANLMARVRETDDFAAWLADFLPDIPASRESEWLEPAAMLESADYKLAHLAGLNLSRTWMLASIAVRLPADDPRRAILATASAAHAETGLSAALRTDYGASHWLPTFAVYCLTHSPKTGGG
ncbi:MAG: DUF2891 domain-containing protein [Gammaproteobacteria bacterium]